ncbi:MAG: hypothetical protein ACXIUZ_00660 [Lysobacteraceae bacterium]
MTSPAKKYLTRITEVKTLGDYLENWKLGALISQHGAWCRLCGNNVFKPSPLVEMSDYQTLATLIPASLGALPSTNNQVIACLGCRRSKGNLDWLEWNRAVDPNALAKQRREVSTQACFNHLVKAKEDRNKLNAVRETLASRWAHPRFVAYAWCSPEIAFIGFKAHLPTGPVSQVLCRALAPVDVTEGKEGVVYCYAPEHFLDVAWTLIEHNGYLKPVPPTPKSIDATPVRDGLEDWRLVFPDIKTLRRGAYSKRRYLKTKRRA